MTLIKKFLQDDSGVTAIEYGLIAVVLSVAILTAVRGLEGQISATFTAIGNQLTQAAPGAAGGGTD